MIRGDEQAELQRTTAGDTAEADGTGATVSVVGGWHTRELRRAVLRPQLSPGSPLPGDDQLDAVHLAVRDRRGQVLAACFVFPDPCPWFPEATSWRLRQMATDPAHRGAGHGTALLRSVVRLVATAGGQVLWCHARVSAQPFYESAGFRPYGQPYPDAEVGEPHIDMATMVGNLA